MDDQYEEDIKPESITHITNKKFYIDYRLNKRIKTINLLKETTKEYVHHL